MADAVTVTTLLLERCVTLGRKSVYPVAYPEAAFEPPADGKYFAVQIFNNTPGWEGLTDGRMDQGLLQVSINWPRNDGLLGPAGAVTEIMDAFPKGLKLFGPGVRVVVNREPWAASPLIEADRLMIPVTIPWVAI